MDIKTFSDYWTQTLKNHNWTQYAGYDDLTKQPKDRQQKAKKFISNTNNMLVFGPAGVGKTTYAVAILREIAKSAFKLHTPHFGMASINASGNIVPKWEYINWSGLTDLLRNLNDYNLNTSARQHLGRLKRAETLILDDFGYTPLRDQPFADLFGLIDERNAKLRTMYITTLRRGQMIANFNAACADRITGSAWTVAWPEDTPSMR